MSTGFSNSDHQHQGFVWWTIQGWASLFVGTLIAIGLYKDSEVAAVVLGALNIGLSVMIIRFSRVAFIVGTVLTINPILWIVNGIYVRNRWNNPRVLENKVNEELAKSETRLGRDRIESTRNRADDANNRGPVTADIPLDPAIKPSLSMHEARITSDEELWDLAMRESDSPDRRQGLWAKCYGEAQGVESTARAAYMSIRVGEMKAAIYTEQLELDKKRRLEEEELRLAHLNETEKAFERLPKGNCPNCDTVIPVTSTECLKCKAIFGPGSNWKVKPKS